VAVPLERLTRFTTHPAGADRRVPWLLPAALLIPPLGAVLLAAASRSEGAYRLLVKEDGVLEWAQVVSYVAVIAVGALSMRDLWRRERASAIVVAGLALVALLSAGEELSWGQRIVGFDTPEIAADNRQGELTLHNDARFEHAARFAFLFAGLYGIVMPFTARRTPFAPPRALVGFFGVAAGYMGYRLLFLEHPSYTEAKYSEWPELCLAVGVCVWCLTLASRRRIPSP
jgi:hypothetical protein